jgi:uncharacterized membrane protein YgaE (UPF0421/DUF939 family)
LKDPEVMLWKIYWKNAKNNLIQLISFLDMTTRENKFFTKFNYNWLKGNLVQKEEIEIGDKNILIYDFHVKCNEEKW